MKRCPRASPHIERKKKEKKNKGRNGTGSAGMLMNLGKSAEVPRQKCGGWWELIDRNEGEAVAAVTSDSSRASPIRGDSDEPDTSR
jgi:hypothetical protein